MLYHFLYPLADQISLFNVFKYISFRSFLAFVVAALISILWGRRFIRFMQRVQFGQSVREDGPESHKVKRGTPTAGGLFILGSVLITTLLCGNFASESLIAVLLLMVSYAALGFWDDYLKVIKKDSKGVSARGKLLWQFVSAFVVGFYLIRAGIIDTELYIPFMKEPIMNLGWGYLLFASVVIVGSSNAVNITDGLDGLAIGPIMTSAFALGLMAYAAGRFDFASYLLIPYSEGAGELLVLSAALIGAGIGFLWYNSYPAQVFMGDVGSLSLGGVLGLLAVLTKNEFLFSLIGGIFVIEALSVILQVSSFKLRKKRIFKMAPIHHHFELKGWSEPKVIVRFWIVSLLFAISALATLKLR